MLPTARKYALQFLINRVPVEFGFFFVAFAWKLTRWHGTTRVESGALKKWFKNELLFPSYRLHFRRSISRVRSTSEGSFPEQRLVIEPIPFKWYLLGVKLGPHSDWSPLGPGLIQILRRPSYHLSKVLGSDHERGIQWLIQRAWNLPAFPVQKKELESDGAKHDLDVTDLIPRWLLTFPQRWKTQNTP